MAGTIQLQGAKDIAQAIAALSKGLSPAAIRKHLRKGGNVIAAEAKLNAQTVDTTGELTSALGVINNPEDVSGVILGPRRSKKFRQGYFAHLYEFGAAPHLTRPGVSHPGIKATPFLRPAWELKKKEALQKIREGLQKEVNNTLTIRRR